MAAAACCAAWMLPACTDGAPPPHATAGARAPHLPVCSLSVERSGRAAECPGLFRPFAADGAAVGPFRPAQPREGAGAPGEWPRCIGEGDARPPCLPPRTARLLFAGDVMQHLPQVFAARRADGTHDYTSVFEGVAPYFAAADLVAVNLETTLTASGDYAGYPCFRSPLSLAAALGAAGVDVCALANNHCCDGGAQGIRTTLAELDRLGIRHTGVFADSLSLRRDHPLILTAGGIRFALLNYTYSTNGIPVPPGVAVRMIDTAVMRRDLASARAAADCTVVLIHWGDEYQRREHAAQRSLAAFLRRHGTDVVVGSHPHVIQPWVADSSHVVLYSLGNLVSGQRRRYTDGGLVATVEAVRHPEGRMTYRLETTPVWVSVPGYRILTPEAADTMTLPAAYGIFRADLDALPGNGL